MSIETSVRRGATRAGTAYKSFLWSMMDRLGIDESLWWKIMVAVGLQFAAGVALAVAVAALGGTAMVVAAGGFLVLAAIAFFNTALIVREDLILPLRRLESSAERVAEGSLDVDPPAIEQDDEVGSLSTSFVRMHETLRTTARQADALASESFDDPALDRSVPGEFGDALDRMAENLSTAISDLEDRSARLTRLIEEFETASARASDGDLGVRLSEETVDERFDGVVTSYNEQLDAFETAIARAKPFAADVADASASVRGELAAVSETSTENAERVEEIAGDASRQSESLDSLSGDAETLSATVEEIAATANELSEIAAKTADSADDGASAAEDARATLHGAADIAAETDEAVSRLVERTESIREIVTFIDDVASQTDLLAVNASIEASRADTDTAGFEVVAGEVKSLAEETHESANDIEALIDEVDEETHAVASAVDELTDRIETAVETVDEATDEFVAIAEDTARVNDSAAEISSATDQQAKVASGVSATVDELADIGDATAERADAVASNTADASARLRNVTDSVGTLAEQAERLATELEAFDVSERDPDRMDLSDPSDHVESGPHDLDEADPDAEIAADTGAEADAGAEAPTVHPTD